MKPPFFHGILPSAKKIKRVFLNLLLKPFQQTLNEQHSAFYKDILASLQAGTLAIFAGAGLSAPAGFVDWPGLLEEISAELGGISSDGKNLVMLAQEHVNQTGGRSIINDAILNAFEKRASQTETHRLFSRLNIDTFWTTNYDGLIEQALQAAGRTPDVKHRPTQLTQNLKNADSLIYKMHGDRLSPNETILTLDDYIHYQDTHGPFLDMLSTDLIRKRFLFIGISFEDPNLEWVFNRLHNQLGEAQRHHWYFILRDKSNGEQQQKFVERLKTYSLLPVWINQYNEIPEILKEIEERLINHELGPLMRNENKHERIRGLGRLTDKYPFHARLLGLIAHVYGEDQEYDSCRKCLESILTINPNDYQSLSSLGGLIHNHWQDYELAEKYFLRSIAINDQYEQAQTNIGNNYKQLKKFDKASYHYHSAIQLDPNEASPHNGLAECYEHFGEPEKARDHYLEALRLEPDDLVTLNNLANLHYVTLNEPEKARYYFEQALPLAEKEATVHLNYGYLLMYRFNELSLARRHFEKAGRIDRENYKAPYALAMLLEKTKTDQEGVALRLEEAISINPNVGEIHRFMGEFISRRGAAQREQTIACFRKAVELNPSDATAWYNLGWVQLFHYKEYHAAAPSFEQAIALGIQEHSCYYNLFLIYKFHLAQPQKAKEIITNMLPLFPNDGRVRLQLGDIALEEKAYETAIQYYREAIALAGQANKEDGDESYLSTAYLQLAGTLSNYTSDQEGARTAAEISIQLYPEAIAYFNYGIILGRLNRKKEAFAAFENSLKADPTHVFARWNIIEALQEKKSHVKALEHIDYLMTQDESNPEFRSLAASIYYHAGQDLCETDRTRAEELMRKAMPLHPAYRRPFLAAAQRFYKKQDYETAVYFQKLAVTHEEPIADAFEVMGMWLVMHFDQRKEAIPYLEQAIKTQPSFHAHFNLGAVSEELGHYRAAADNYLKAIELKPDHHKAIAQLQRLRINGLV